MVVVMHVVIMEVMMVATTRRVVRLWGRQSRALPRPKVRVRVRVWNRTSRRARLL